MASSSSVGFATPPPPPPPSSGGVSRPRPTPTPSTPSVSYEKFAPRSSSQVARLSRIAALTAGPTSRAVETVTRDDSSDFLLQAMSPPPAPSTTSSSVLLVEKEGESKSNEDTNDLVQTTLDKTLASTDHLIHVLKHTTSLRLALRASINIAEDISNRHAELIRHSGELSAAADRLQDEEAMLTRHAEEIGLPLKHYDAVDRIGIAVGVLFKGKTTVRGLAKIKVDDDEFPDLLDEIDNAVAFFSKECGGKDALIQAEKQSKGSQLLSGNVEYYRRALALQDAALYLIREAVVDRISNTSNQVASALNIPKVPIAADKLEASLIYTRFHGISARSNRLLGLVRRRLNRGDAYAELLHLCRTTYCNSRENLLKITIRTHMDKLREQHGLVGMTRLASVFLIRLCTVETSLYLDFFGDKKQPPPAEEKTADENADKAADANKDASKKKATNMAAQVMSDDGTYYDSEFQNYLTNLCSSLHRTIRRGLVTMVSVAGKECGCF